MLKFLSPKTILCRVVGLFTGSSEVQVHLHQSSTKGSCTVSWQGPWLTSQRSDFDMRHAAYGILDSLALYVGLRGSEPGYSIANPKRLSC